MDKSLVKRAYSEAHDSLKEKQVEEVKRIVLKTLEKIETLKKDKDKAQESVKDIEEQIRLLRMDLDAVRRRHLDPTNGVFSVIDPNAEYTDPSTLPWGANDQDVDPELDLLIHRK